ncbi:MAG: XRE family transcriptional regulator [Muribaculaceae bacterium]|nr:XRE family transcriptional regulator [Muribaculaceae bacterium]
MEQIHIGSIIRCELRKQNRSNRWLADQIGVIPRTINKIFLKQDMDTTQLFRISKAMQVDFFSYYSKELKK